MSETAQAWLVYGVFVTAIITMAVSAFRAIMHDDRYEDVDELVRRDRDG